MLDNFDYDYFDDDDNDVDDDVQGDVEDNAVQGDHLVMLREMMCRVQMLRVIMMMYSVLGGEEELPDEGDLDAAIAALARLSSSLSTITSSMSTITSSSTSSLIVIIDSS